MIDRIRVRAVCILALAVSVLLPFQTVAQTAAAGARDAALAGASAATAGTADLWAESNPAGWARLERAAAAVHVAQLYGLDELRLGSVLAAVIVGGTPTVAGIRTFGYHAYRETVFTAGLARAIRWSTHRPFHVGVRFRRHQTSIPSYGSASVFAVSTGLSMPVAAGTNIGLAAENMLTGGGHLAGELPRRLHAGVSFSAGALVLHAAAAKASDLPLTSRFGIEVFPVEVLALRAGYALEPARYAGGVGIRLDPLTINVAAERHLVLGWTPSCSVRLQW